MQAIERIRAALKHLKDVPGSLKTGLGIDEYRAACRPVAMSEVLSHITALEAENERLKDLADSEGSRAVEYLRRARNVEAEVERLRKDAERYRWLKSAKGLTLESERGSAWTREDGTKFTPSHRLCAGGTQFGPHEHLDDSIDAAMKGTP